MLEFRSEFSPIPELFRRLKNLLVYLPHFGTEHGIYFSPRFLKISMKGISFHTIFLRGISLKGLHSIPFHNMPTSPLKINVMCQYELKSDWQHRCRRSAVRAVRRRTCRFEVLRLQARLLGDARRCHHCWVHQPRPGCAPSKPSSFKKLIS